MAISNHDVGIFLSDSTDNTLTENIACLNRYHDIMGLRNIDDLGLDNTCDDTYDWDDTGTTGCASSCPEICSCSTCEECELKLNSPSCSYV